MPDGVGDFVFPGYTELPIQVADRQGADTDTAGDMVGDHELSAQDVTDLPRYVPYHDGDSPLYALDWGSQVDGTVRNPDGRERDRITGNEFEQPDDKGASVDYFGNTTDGKNVIKIYFAKAGDVYTPEDPTSPGLPSAIVAVIQDKYGVNQDWARGNDVYTLKDVNAAGTFYSSIWDTGGRDTMVYDGARDTTIDLRPATLRYEVGGGFVSFADGIFGGFTIANGVVIENARGGAGDDTPIGNDADNLLVGNDGADVLRGGLGSDDRRGGDGIDSASYAGAGRGVTVDLSSTGFQDTGGAGLDRLTDIEGLIGSSFADVLTGGAGANRLEGGVGVDTLTGGGGRDVFVFDEGDSGATRATADRILDFSRRVGDKIDLTGIDAVRGNTTPVTTDPITGETSGGAPIDDAFTFIGSGAFTGVAGQLRAARNGSTSIVSGDTDGDRVADLMIIVTSDQAMRAADFLF